MIISGIDVDCEEASDEDADLLEVEAALTAISHHGPISVLDISREYRVDDPDFEDGIVDLQTVAET